MGKSALILGYGLEGKSTHRFLLKNDLYENITIADDNLIELIPEAKLDTEIIPSVNIKIDSNKHQIVFRSPGISKNSANLKDLVRKGGKLSSATKLFFEHCPGKIIGITGTKGKSTTSSILAKILEKQFSDVRLVGNIGTPTLSSLKQSSDKTIFVTELSSFQLEDLEQSPHIAILLNIVPEHLDYHKNFEEYCRAKTNIFRFQSKNDFLITNSKHQLLSELSNSTKSTILNPDLERVESLLKQTKLNSLVVMTEGNLKNLAAAISCASLLKVSDSAVLEALSELQPLPHRLEYLGNFSNIDFYDDSLSTIPESTINALEAFGDKISTLIAGGYDRGLNFSKLAQVIIQTKLENLILFPDTGNKIQAEIERFKNKHDLNLFLVESMKDAVEIAYKYTPPKKTCLLSPASPSFGLFKSYKERGEEFRKYIKLLSQ